MSESRGTPRQLTKVNQELLGRRILSEFEFTRTLIGLICIGTAERAIEITVEWTKQRQAFGQAISHYQGVSFPLAEHSTQNQFVYYHQWRVGDLLMWDELSTMHRGAGDYQPDERRIMLRTIVYSS